MELAFMSTTLKMSVALQYARKGAMPIIFEIDVGQVSARVTAVPLTS